MRVSGCRKCRRGLQVTNLCLQYKHNVTKCIYRWWISVEITKKSHHDNYNNYSKMWQLPTCTSGKIIYVSFTISTSGKSQQVSVSKSAKFTKKVCYAYSTLQVTACIISEDNNQILIWMTGEKGHEPQRGPYIRLPRSGQRVTSMVRKLWSAGLPPIMNVSNASPTCDVPNIWHIWALVWILWAAARGENGHCRARNKVAIWTQFLWFVIVTFTKQCHESIMFWQLPLLSNNVRTVEYKHFCYLKFYSFFNFLVR